MTEGSAYGQRVDPAGVSYEPHHVRADGPGVAIDPPYYYRVSDGARVVWVNAANAVGVDPERGYFALWTGPADEYRAIVTEAA